MFVSPWKFLCCNSTCHVIGIRRWDLGEVTRIGWGNEGEAFVSGISALVRVRRELPSLLSTMWVYENQQSASWNRVLTRIWPWWHLDIQFPVSKLCEKQTLVVHSPLSWCIFSYSSLSWLKQCLSKITPLESPQVES